MDWITLVLIFIFFVLPLIQQVLESRKRSSPPIETEEGHLGEEGYPADVAGSHPEEVRSRTGDDWSTGWGNWPVEPETETATEAGERRGEVSTWAGPAWDDAGPDVRREQAPAYPTPAPAAERGLRERPQPAIRVRVERAPGQEGPAQGLVRRPRTPLQVVVPAARQHPLRNRRELRRAIMFNEVLGLPKSVREHPLHSPADPLG